MIIKIHGSFHNYSLSTPIKLTAKVVMGIVNINPMLPHSACITSAAITSWFNILSKGNL